MFLSDDEISELTQRKQCRAQAMILNALGIVHKRRPDGSIVILRAHVEQQLGLAPKAKQATPEYEPNWAALETVTKRRG